MVFICKNFKFFKAMNKFYIVNLLANVIKFFGTSIPVNINRIVAEIVLLIYLNLLTICLLCMIVCLFFNDDLCFALINLYIDFKIEKFCI